MLTFAFTVLVLLLAFGLGSLALYYQRQEFNRRWRQYRKLAFKQVKPIKDRLEAHVEFTNRQLQQATRDKSNGMINFPVKAPFAKTEDRYEEQELKRVKVMDNKVMGA